MRDGWARECPTDDVFKHQAYVFSFGAIGVWVWDLNGSRMNAKRLSNDANGFQMDSNESFLHVNAIPMNLHGSVEDTKP